MDNLAPLDRPITARELNRATLARQLLLDRTPLDPVSAISRLVALQAQEPASPYLALWTRLAGFDARALDEAITSHRVVKATLLRVTLHMVTAADYPGFWAVVAASHRRARVHALGLDPDIDAARIDELFEAALAFAAVPRSNGELTSHLAMVGESLDRRDWWWAIRGMAPFVHAAGHLNARATWSYGHRPAHVAARSWIRMTEVDPAVALDAFVRRYLAGFGPATIGDIATIARLGRDRVRASVERLRPTLRSLVDVDGRELLDVPDGALPGPDVAVPVRYLPMWDSVLLAYEDRSRVIPPDVRRLVIRSNGDILPTFLVDGRVAGVWRAEVVRGETVIVRHAFRQLPPSVTAELDAEADALARFVEPREPEVYRRYRRWWARLD